MNISSANRFELQQIIQSVSHERGIEQEVVVQAIEESMAKAAKQRYGHELDIRAMYNKETGELNLIRVRKVVDIVEIRNTEIALDDAKKIDSDLEQGSEFEEELPPVNIDEMDRIIVQNAIQVIVQRIREAERDRQYEEFKDKVGQIVFGTVNREEYGNIIVNVSVGEAVIQRNQRIGREPPQKGERIRAIVTDVSREQRGPQVKLSRTSPEFMKELFRNEVPEFYEGSIDILRVARDPGSRAKIAVVSYDASIDPVGACVGMRGSRVQAVVNELQGERIDVIPWIEDEFDFIVEALRPAQVLKGIYDAEGRPTTIVVPDNMLAWAIGARGQNVRLARSLTNLDLKIVTESDAREQREAKMVANIQDLMDSIDINEALAQFLVSDDFTNVETIANSSLDELESCNGIDEHIARELQLRAIRYLEKEAKELLEEAARHGLKDDLANFQGLSPAMLLALTKERIVSLKDFAECAAWELVGEYTTVNGRRVKETGILEEFELSKAEIEMMIMTARALVGIVDPNVLLEQMDESEEDNEPGTTEES